MALAVWAAARQGLPDRGTVHAVVDGDTIELAGGERVRYVGIDTPEVRRRVGERWVYDPEPLAKDATEANRRLVDGQAVRLEYDVQPRDRYGRLLAYVYVSPPGQGEIMVNARLLEQGYAQPLTIPPNVKHAETFRALAEQAREGRRGLWTDR